jgi:hypothetical protein
MRPTVSCNDDREKCSCLRPPLQACFDQDLREAVFCGRKAPNRLPPRSAIKKKPRAMAGLKLNERRYEKGPDLAKAGPTTLVAGSPVDRNAGFSPDVPEAWQATRNRTLLGELDPAAGSRSREALTFCSLMPWSHPFGPIYSIFPSAPAGAPRPSRRP